MKDEHSQDSTPAITWPQHAYIEAIEAATQALECFEDQRGEPLLWAAYRETRRAQELFPAYSDAVREQSGHDLAASRNHVHDLLAIVLRHMDQLAEERASGSVGKVAEQAIRRRRIVAELKDQVQFLAYALEYRRNSQRTPPPRVKSQKVTFNWLFTLVGKRTGVTRKAVQKIYEGAFTTAENTFVIELISAWGALNVKRRSAGDSRRGTSLRGVPRPDKAHPWRK